MRTIERIFFRSIFRPLTIINHYHFFCNLHFQMKSLPDIYLKLIWSNIHYIIIIIMFFNIWFMFFISNVILPCFFVLFHSLLFPKFSIIASGNVNVIEFLYMIYLCNNITFFFRWILWKKWHSLFHSFFPFNQLPLL